MANLQFLEGADLRSGVERSYQSAVRGELDAIIVGGGDGSIRTAAAVLANSEVPLGILPMGTLNHFAKDLKIPLVLEEAVTIIAAGESRRIDLAEVNGQIFINNSSIGIYPYMVLERERRQRGDGMPKWPAMMLAGLKVLKNFPVRRLLIQGSDLTEPCRSPCVFIGNNVYHFAGPAAGGRDRMDAGQLCLCVAKQETRLGMLRLGIRSIIGRFDQSRDLRIMTLAEFVISSKRKRLLVASDGEIEILKSPLHYKIRPGALRILAPIPDNVE